MIKELKNIYRNLDDNSIVSTEVHDILQFGYNRSKYFGPTDTYLSIEWKYNDQSIAILDKNIILSLPNKNFSLITLLIMDKSKYLGGYIKMFNDKGELFKTLDFPNLKILEKYPKLNYKPSISFSWYNNEKIEKIKNNSSVEIDINLDIEVTFWFPDYREECCLLTEKGRFSKIYFTVDEERYLDKNKNNPKWY
jgi:hypothetical protein